MPAGHSVSEAVVEGRPVRVLSSHEHDVHVAFAPALAMVACSLRHRGEELLGLRSGLDAYARTGATMGIPLLYPWANRLSGFDYRFAGRAAALEGLTPLDEHGLPIHGLLAGVRDWSLLEAEAGADGARVVAGRDGELDGFQLPHAIEVEARLRGATLTIETTLRATGSLPVPVCFGYHPYLRLPGVPRAEWAIEAPVREHVDVDARAIPTGERSPAAPLDGPLGARTFDDGFLAGDEPFVLAGGGRRLEVAFEEGYPYAQLFAPAADEVVCFEPMTAPADALRRGDPPAVQPGDSYRARFSVSL